MTYSFAPRGVPFQVRAYTSRTRSTASRASSGHDQRDGGTPVSAGNWQAGAAT